MSDPQVRVRKYRSHRRRARAFLAFCAIAIFGLAILAVVGVPQPAPTETQSSASSSGGGGALVSEFAAALPPREVYRYSVIDGGAYTAADVAEAVHRDSVVAEHYRSINVEHLRPETVGADQFAYMSYRRGDRIYWTRNKVRLRQGETILTDGVSQVRSRCGNCISLEPMQPTAEDEPDSVEFDALTSDPVVVASLPFSPYTLTLPPGLLLPTPFGTAPFEPVGPISIGPIGETFGDFDPHDPGDPRDPGDPSGFDPHGGPLPVPPRDFPSPRDPFDPGGPFDPGDPPPVLVDIPPLFDPPIFVPEHFDPEDPLDRPDDPAPVPEPGTLLLVGGGGIGLLLRRLRSK